jgi:outer membrane immunogenic protein
MVHVRFAALAVALSVIGVFSLSGSVAFAQCATSTGSNSASGSGAVGGAQVGYNWQQGSSVYGLETDISGSSLKSSMSGGLSAGCPGDAASTSAKIDWYGTLRGRAGWVSGNALFYGTAGLAYGKVDLTSSYTGGGTALNSQASSTRAGWVIGAGIDYMLQPNLFLNFGYQYVDLGTVSLAASAAGPPAISQSVSAHASFHVVTAGLSWKFSPDGGASMPWQGAYAGGHAGGAFGLNTNASYTSP